MAIPVLNEVLSYWFKMKCELRVYYDKKYVSLELTFRCSSKRLFVLWKVTEFQVRPTRYYNEESKMMLMNIGISCDHS